jgi:tyrosine-protein phosphatase SIW14
MEVLGALRARRRWWLVLVLALPLVASLVLVFARTPRRLAEVEPGWLYRSGQLHPSLVQETLDDLDIDVVIDLTPAGSDKRPAELAAVRALGIDWQNFPLRGDGTGDIASYAGAIAALDAAHRDGRRVLVHCFKGVRRTGGVLAAYLTLVEGASPERALAELQRFVNGERESVALDYLDQNLPELLRDLAARGVSVQPEPERRMALLRRAMTERT